MTKIARNRFSLVNTALRPRRDVELLEIAMHPFKTLRVLVAKHKIELEYAPLDGATDGLSTSGKIIVDDSLPLAERFAVPCPSQDPPDIVRMTISQVYMRKLNLFLPIGSVRKRRQEDPC